MGRPPLGMVSTNVGLPPGVAERIQALVGQKRMAGFIRDAVVRALEEAESATEPMAERPPVSDGRSREKNAAS